ncbi:MAG: N-acylglucosamine 2-epimerase [Ruminococcaceae bacterium]|nr:N-acylglucosamine 2-epimerase [Oscillospiraceae bacterium]
MLIVNFKNDLLNNILPFWLNNAIDRENGGIFTCLDREGNIYGTDKSVWFQGRALWSFCKAYNSVEKRPEFLEAAKCIYDFLPKCTDTDGRMYFTVTKDGRGLQKRRYYFSETFAAIGCAEYYKATNDINALEMAEKYFTVAYECFTGKRENAPKINPENYKAKALSPVMIMLSTAQVMRSMESDKKEWYSEIAGECLNEVLYGGFLTEKALLESVTTYGKAVDSPNGRIVNPGHSMEAAWFIMLEGVLTNNQIAICAARNIIDITWPLGWDQRGGIIAFCDVEKKPPVQLEWDMKLWWPQCETLIALRMAYMLFGEEKYKVMYDTVLNYCEEHFVDKQYGEWYGYLHYDNTISTTLKGNIFKGPFHIPRLYALMSVLDETEDIKRLV